MSEQRTRIETYVEQLRSDSRRYAEHVWQELEKLRALSTALEREHEVIAEHNRQLRERVAAIEAESSRYAEQYFDVEQQNTQLANFYVTVHQLHSTLDREAVIAGIKEIVVNLIGSEEMAIFERRGDELVLVGSFGADVAALAVWPLRDGGFVAEAVRSNEIFIRNGEAAAIAAETELTACVPLRVADEVTGAIAVFRLLQHKTALEPVDRELFELLATQAGVAL